ncbi:MAG: hypothetical protein ACRDCY_12300 [Aeromonas veronii]
MLTTRAYQQWLNGEQRCGISQWRLPTMGELMSLMHYGSLAKDPLGQRIIVDTRCFPDVAPSEDGFFNGYYSGAPPATPPSASPVAPSANALPCSWEKMRAPPIPRWCSKINISS